MVFVLLSGTTWCFRQSYASPWIPRMRHHELGKMVADNTVRLWRSGQFLYSRYTRAPNCTQCMANMRGWLPRAPVCMRARTRHHPPTRSHRRIPTHAAGALPASS
jgi:hypothetical protein